MSTEAVVLAVREVAAAHGHGVRVSHDIGADRVSRRTDAPIGAVTDPDGSLPHEAFLETATEPRLEVTVYPDGDAVIVVEGVEFHDVPADDVPAFVRCVYDGAAHVTGGCPSGVRRLPPLRWLAATRWLVVPLPHGPVHREPVLPLCGTRWLTARTR